MNESLAFYATPGLLSAPGEQAGLLDHLPSEVEALCRVVQGLMIHVFWAERYGVQLDATRRDEVQLRSVARQLARITELDARPLDQAREPAKRLVGNCRDFSVMLTTMLRHQGIPARARCGFARYFLPNHYEDHWVCEVWNAARQRWVLVDAQLDALQSGVLALSFSPLDVPRDQFIVGGKAWQLCRAGQADPETFGIFDMHGFSYVRGNLLRDVASLNKVELLPWDSWGLVMGRHEDLSPDDLAALDRIAALTQGDVPEHAEMRQLYLSDQRLCVPATIQTYAQGRVQTVELARI